MLKVVNLRTRRCPQLIGRIGGPHRWLWLLTIVNHLIRRFTVMSNCATIKPLKVSSWNKVVDNDRSTILKRAEGAPLVKLWAFYKIFAGFKFKHKIKFDLPDWRYRIWKITPHVTIFWKIRHHLTMMVRRKNILFLIDPPKSSDTSFWSFPYCEEGKFHIFRSYRYWYLTTF